ncbi:MAG: hypothetical protein COT92_01910 [Candidatus Doudnabacteria bacterium CG10_big_fil_rev_8_21_14_0_10_42_18]|uniref:Uncharacterized protein n=1 Tax=Candidatus Doudnabacteria bacterium CG10_big_fil_rev_8_21_14_0_10_42_18 TaxID=1974552 RepID=A0A2H0VB19_9BACT|nr:MAG: hypothetical protein COT92_01910 [Candidatus Doudnabacteria bacterium CG10_big_fil_rev_8_21_14_0_10_42_18]
MPSLEEKYINLLKELYRKKEGKDLPDLEAVKKFNNLITLVKNIYRPIPKSKAEEVRRLAIK